MKNKYIIEFWHDNEAIETKKSNSPLIIPREGEAIAILTWENPNNSCGRDWWKVLEVKHIIFENESRDTLTQKIMLDIIPDPKNGLFKSDSDYKSTNF